MSTTNEDLCELAHKHDVCYEIYPEYMLINDERVQTGFDLELYGIREQDAMRLTPADKDSHLAYSDLQKIAQFAASTKSDGNDYTIQPFDSALHESPRRHFRPEVTCAIGITHRHDIAGQEACEERCLASIETKLRSLGIPRAH